VFPIGIQIIGKGTGIGLYFSNDYPYIYSIYNWNKHIHTQMWKMWLSNHDRRAQNILFSESW